jgi:O-antigen/teichoic acid export membrane protein
LLDKQIQLAVIKNIFYNTLLSISQVVFPLLTFPYATRILGPEKLGLVNFADAYTRYFMLLAALSLPLYGVRVIAKAKDDTKDLSSRFYELLIIHVVTTFSLLTIYIITIFAVPKLSMHSSLYVWGALMLVSNLFTFEWFFAGISEFKFIAVRTFFIRILFIILFFILIKTESDYELYFILTVIGNIISSIVNIFYIKNFLKESYRKSQLSIKNHIKPIFFLFGAIAAISLYATLDTVILGFSASDTSVGYYATSMRINRIIISILGSFSLVVYPQLSRLHNTNFVDSYNNIINKLVYAIITICIPLLICLIAVSNDIIIFFAGDNFLPAVQTFRVLSVICLFVSLSNIFGNLVLTSKNKDKEYLIAALSAGLVGVLLNLILAPILKEKGTAISSVAAEFTMAFATWFFARKNIQITFNKNLFIKHLVFAIPYLIIIKAILIFIPILSVRLILFPLLLLPYFFVSQFFLLKNEVLQALYKRVERNFKNEIA